MGIQRKGDAIQPARMISPADAERVPIEAPDYGFGFRYGTTTPKGLGFLGGLQRPDGRVMSEYSIGVPLNGREREMPSIVPTLTHEELQHILSMKDGDPMPDSIVQKAVAFAQQRQAAGLPLFANPGEQQNLYPDVPRSPVPTIQRRKP